MIDYRLCGIFVNARTFVYTKEQGDGNVNGNVNPNPNLKAAIKRVKNHACMSSVEREQTRYKVSTLTLTKRAKLERVVVSR